MLSSIVIYVQCLPTNEPLHTCHRTKKHIDTYTLTRVITPMTARHLTRENLRVWANALHSCIPMLCVHLIHSSNIIHFRVHAHNSYIYTPP